MQIAYNNTTLYLEDMPIDIGYASDKVILKDSDNETFEVGGQNGFTQIIFTAPFINDNLVSQMKELNELLNLNALNSLCKSLVVATDRHDNPMIEGWDFGMDHDESFGDFYGVRLSPGELGGEFTKAMFVISKDGALFYHEILTDLIRPFSIDKALTKIAAAHTCYTGKGCHE